MFLNNVCHFAGAWDLALDVCELAQFLFGLLHLRTALDTTARVWAWVLCLGLGLSEDSWPQTTSEGLKIIVKNTGSSFSGVIWQWRHQSAPEEQNWLFGHSAQCKVNSRFILCV